MRQRRADFRLKVLRRLRGAQPEFDVAMFGEDSFANLFALCIGQMERWELHILRHGAAVLFHCSWWMLIFIGVSAAHCEHQNTAPTNTKRDDMARSSNVAALRGTRDRAAGCGGTFRRALNGFAFAFEDSVLNQIRDSLPAGAVKASHHVDAHDLHQPVLEFHGAHGPVTDISDRGDPAGAGIPRAGIDCSHRLFRPGAGTSELHELLRLLRRVADDAYANCRVAVCGRLAVLVGLGEATDERSRRGGCQKDAHNCCLQNWFRGLLRNKRPLCAGVRSHARDCDGQLPRGVAREEVFGQIAGRLTLALQINGGTQV